MENQNIPLPSEKSFGNVFGLIFLLIGLYPTLKGANPFYYLILLSIIMFLIAFMKPTLLHLPNKAWFRFGMFLGGIVSPIVLGFVFVVAFCSTSLIFKILRKDPLEQSFDSRAKSYWKKRVHPLESFEKQF